MDLPYPDTATACSPELRLRMPRLPRVIASLVAVVSVVSCSGPLSSPASTTAPRADPEIANGVIESLDVLDEALGSVEDADIAMAWSDLNGDMRSLIDDAIQHSDVGYFDGARNRMEGFHSRFSSHDAVTAASDQWKRLVASLDDLGRSFGEDPAS